MANKFHVSQHVILYFDILGYKTILNKGLIDEDYFINAINDLNKQIKGFAKDVKARVLLFSDNCIVCWPYDNILQIPNILCSLVVCAQFIQRNMAIRGLFIRGSISIGDIYIGKSFVYGSGLIKAYSIENEIAKYPRIVVEDELINLTLNFLSICKEREHIQIPDSIIFPDDINEKNMFGLLKKVFKYDDKSDNYEQFWNSVKLQKDNDNVFFVDFLQNVFSEVAPDEINEINLTQSFAAGGKHFYGALNNDISAIQLGLCVICTYVMFAINDNKNIEEHKERCKVLNKYFWCCAYINRFFSGISLKEPFTTESINHCTGLNLEELRDTDFEISFNI